MTSAHHVIRRQIWNAKNGLPKKREDWGHDLKASPILFKLNVWTCYVRVIRHPKTFRDMFK